MITEYLHKDLTDKIIKIFYDVYNELGYGFLEKVYHNAMFYELWSKGLIVDSQKKIDVFFKSQLVGEYYADLVVENKVILELKTVEYISNVHIAQAMNYLKATNIEIALLLNFGVQPQIKRVIYTNDRK
ncbi:MAG: GxxExxY protein [Flavobacterium sp.]